MGTIFDWLLREIEVEFDTVKCLKQSARGSIYLLRHRRTGERFILRRTVENTEVYRRLLGYACRNLPQTLEVAEGPEETLVLEEFVSGDTLDALLQGALFTEKETRKIVKQICQGLWVLHSMGCVHRDIKPENVILRGDEAVLIDFDAARFYKPGQDTDTQVLGTVGFAAPEQYGLGQSDARADIYSVGVLINVMLTGEHPSRALAPGRMGRIVERCTRAVPERRYQNVLRLMADL